MVIVPRRLSVVILNVNNATVCDICRKTEVFLCNNLAAWLLLYVHVRFRYAILLQVYHFVLLVTLESVPVVRRMRFHADPGLVQNLYYLFRYKKQQGRVNTIHSRTMKVETLTQRALLQIKQILLYMGFAARSNQHGVTILPLEQAVVGDPSEGDLRQSQTVLLCDGRDLGERGEVMLVPVPLAVALTLAFLWVKA